MFGSPKWVVESQTLVVCAPLTTPTVERASSPLITLTRPLVANGAVAVGAIASHTRTLAMALQYVTTLARGAVVAGFEGDAFNSNSARRSFRARWKIFATGYLVLVLDLHTLGVATTPRGRALRARQLEASVD